jgi:small subunit ribosomal protein S1
MDGLIHISELSWSHVNHPSEVLEIGQDVKVKVLDIDRERQRISLGLKQTQSDPWQQVLETYNEGDTVEGKVTKVVTFGAFVEILPGVEGLVHISELAQHHVENPREVVSQGDLVQAKIIEVDAERRRLSLSLKRVEGGGVTQRADELEAVEGTPNLDLSEEVFPEAEPLVQVEGVSGEPGSPGEAEGTVAEATEETPAEETPVEEPPAEEADASIEADQASPEEPGPGDSEGEPPAAPD